LPEIPFLTVGVDALESEMLGRPIATEAGLRGVTRWCALNKSVGVR